jgi:hypothetical protein
VTAVATIADRRTELAAERDKLSSARGTALLDGEPFDGKRLAEVTVELEALGDAENEEHRRGVVAAAEAARERRRRVVAEIALRDAARLEALKLAQAAMEAAVRALVTFAALTGEVAGLSGQLGVMPSVGFEQNEVELRLSRLVLGALTPLRSRAQGFGICEWWGDAPARDWPAVEQLATGAAIKVLMESKEETKQ